MQRSMMNCVIFDPDIQRGLIITEGVCVIGLTSMEVETSLSLSPGDILTHIDGIVLPPMIPFSVDLFSNYKDEIALKIT